jgi:hypothetical protein
MVLQMTFTKDPREPFLLWAISNFRDFPPQNSFALDYLTLLNENVMSLGLD